MTEPSSKSEVCIECDGTGYHYHIGETCHACGGNGKRKPQPPVSAPESLEQPRQGPKPVNGLSLTPSAPEKCACPEAPCNECCIHSGPKTDSINEDLEKENAILRRLAKSEIGKHKRMWENLKLKVRENESWTILNMMEILESEKPGEKTEK